MKVSEVDPNSLQGRRFGNLLVIALVGGPGGKWQCRCKCSKYPEPYAFETLIAADGPLECGACRLGSPGQDASTNSVYSKDPQFARMYNNWHRWRRQKLFCPEWASSFTVFLEAVGPMPEGYILLQRKDVSKPHSPANGSRWAKGPMEKPESDLMIKLHGRRYTQAEFARREAIELAFIQKHAKRFKFKGAVIIREFWASISRRQRREDAARLEIEKIARDRMGIKRPGRRRKHYPTIDAAQGPAMASGQAAAHGEG